jgi:drug/metabolite transporter (DMT)-like permease
VVFLRWIMVASVLWLIYGRQVRAHWPVIRPMFWRLVLLAFVGFTAFNILFYIASQYTSAVNVGIIQGAMPGLVLIGTVLAYRTRVTALQGIGVVLTMIGVVLIATKGNPASLLREAVNQGDVLMLVACVLYAAYAVALRQRPAMPGVVFFTLLAVFAAITSIPPAIGEALLLDGYGLPTDQGWLVTLYIAVFPSCLAQIFFLRGVDAIGPGRAGVFINLVPVFASLLAVLLLGQEFAWYHAVALVLVLGGVWMAQKPAA